MKLLYAGVGPWQRADALDQAAQDYAQRLQHYVRLDVALVEPAARKSGASMEAVEKQEAAKLLKAALPRARRIALDEHGTLLSTELLAQRLRAWMNQGQDVVLFQGGPTGLHPDLLVGCQERWSLSPLTLPHRLARVVALEALYRAFTVLRGEPYHRA